MIRLPLAIALIWLLSASAASAQLSIADENVLPGTSPLVWDVSGAGHPSIQGYATDISVAQGETVQFKVDTPSSNYRLDIYRIGYYQGLGARLVTTVQPSASLPQTQPACLSDPSTGLVDCGNWGASASWAVPPTATSGVYIAKLVREDPEDGRASHVIFVVRDDNGESDILFQTSDTTWQAYNRYGGNSLYAGQPVGRARKVSYNRPFTARCCLYPDGSEYSFFFNAEYPMVRWLERNGYDVSYTTGVDADRRGAEMLDNHDVYMTVGHDEYWSGPQRANVEAAREQGVHLAFFAGNFGFWKTRFEPSIDGLATSHRTLVTYKETLDNAKTDPLPGVWTGTWRDPRFGPHDGARPENALNGSIFTVNGIRRDTPEVPAVDGQMRLWRDTSVATLLPGEAAVLPNGVLGFEWDEDLDNGARPPGLVRLSTTTVAGLQRLQDYGATYAFGAATHHLTLYRHGPSASLVFAAGTVHWPWGLDDAHDLHGLPLAPTDVRMQQATVNLLAEMEVQPESLQVELLLATASTDGTAPGAVLTAPGPGTSAAAGNTVVVTGTASDVGGAVGGVEVSTDDGVTWHPADGRDAWSYAWVPRQAGTAKLRARAVDDSANLGVASPAVSVTVTATGQCGDGVVDAGEACDGGACCNVSCQFVEAGFICRAADGACDVAEICSGVSASCPSDALAPNGTSCSDADACNGAETCQAGGCDEGPPPVCDDGNVCTDDACNAATGCVVANNTDPCSDGVACTSDICGGGTCQSTPTCGPGDWCNLATGQCEEPPVACVEDTAFAEFAQGTPDAGAHVANHGGGEVVLASAVAEEFAGTSLPAGWTSFVWNAGGSGATVGAGTLRVDGARANPTAAFGPGRSVEFVATFAAAPFQNAGLGFTLGGGEDEALVSTGAAATAVVARTKTSSDAGLETPLGAGLIGTPHRYRIVWGASAVEYYVDGVLTVTHVRTLAGPLRPVASDFNAGGPVLSVDWVRLTPYAPAGRFESRVFNGGVPQMWGTTVFDLTKPAPTGGTLAVRSGSTAVPDGTWSAWTPIAVSGASAGVTGRYVQYEFQATTASPTASPVLERVALSCEAVPAVCGNGNVELGEGCDDGATLPGDGCSAACQFEGPDADADGIPNEYETGTGIYVSPTNTGTDPLDPDTDGDGASDGFELTAGTDPNDPQDVPDLIPPVVSALAVAPTDAAAATVTWTTDELATSGVLYGTSPGNLSQSASSSGLSTSHGVTLTGLSADTPYYVRVVSADTLANQTTSPTPPAAPLAFAMPTAACAADTSFAEFAQGTLDAGAHVADEVGGEVVLAAAVAEEFGGASLPAGWTSFVWNAGGTGATVGSGTLSVDGARANTTATYGPGRSVEFVATFGTAPFQNVGLADELVFATPWALFSTGASGTQLQASTSTGNPLQDLVTSLGSGLLGTQHHYRIVWEASVVEYYVDGALVASHARTLPGTLRPIASDFDAGGPSLSLSWLRLTPFAAAGRFESRVFDGGEPLVWGATVFDLSRPASTNGLVAVRAGPTPVPSGGWSAWTPIATSGTEALVSGRYAQYELQATTADQAVTPLLRRVGLSCSIDLCPDDPNKSVPGECGCGEPEVPGCGAPACSDGIDNDGDGWVDVVDLGCAGAGDLSEKGTVICDDGIDNDGDGRTDFVAAGGGDLGCRTSNSTTERPQCQDGLNNDGQAGIDFDGGDSLDISPRDGVIDVAFNPAQPPVGALDPNCARPYTAKEAPGCGLGFELAFVLAPLAWLRRRRLARR